MWPRKTKKNPEAKKALFMAERHRAEVYDRAEEVKAVVAETVEIRRQNHFAQSFKHLLEGGKPV